MPPKRQPQQPKSVLDLERLVDPQEKDLDKDLCCQICMDIVQQPQECKVCQSIYCLECANDWKRKRNNCPNQCKGAWKLQDPHKKYRAELAQLKFKCQYEDKGCKVLVTFETYEKHEENCPNKNGANSSAPAQAQPQQAAQTYSFGSGRYVQQQQPQQQQQQQQQQPQQTIQKAKYSCQTDNGWSEYDEKTCEIFEKNYQKNVKTFKHKLGQWDYTINLVKMLQINQSTKKNRNIKREGPVFQQQQPQQQQQQQQQPQQQQQQQVQAPYDASKIRFCFRGDNGNWQTYDKEISAEIEKNFQNKKMKFMLKLGGFDYDIDLNKMAQINRTSKKERKMLRKDFNQKTQQQNAQPQAPVQQQQQQQQDDNSDMSGDDEEEKKSDSDMEYRWQWQNRDYGIIKWQNFNDIPLEKKIEKSYSDYKNSGSRHKGNSFEYKARGKDYVIDFKKMVQVNKQTKYDRKVKRIKAEDYESD